MGPRRARWQTELAVTSGEPWSLTNTLWTQLLMANSSWPATTSALCTGRLGPYGPCPGFPKYAPELAVLVEEPQVKATQGVFCKTVGLGRETV